MATIPIESQISTEQLLQAVERLPPHELSSFIAQVLALRARREAPHVDATETALLLRINQGLSVEDQQRFDALVAKRQDEKITPDELRELITLTDQVEMYGTDRVVALEALARLRNVSLDTLMQALGIKPQIDA